MVLTWRQRKNHWYYWLDLIERVNWKGWRKEMLIEPKGMIEWKGTGKVSVSGKGKVR